MSRLTNWQKRIIERTMEGQILANPNGISTRVLNQTVYNLLHSSIPNLNMHHLAGMLSWVYKSYGHTFLIRTPGYSVIV